ncbi:MAG: hypothetical protein COB39_00110 [Marinosulfonomonas sp.]|nr:MAG: hypothetical protein COB39_00110 [Marinosulfonomonas sp.]
MEKQLKMLRALTRMALDVEMMKLQRAVRTEQRKVNQIQSLNKSGMDRDTSLTNNGSADFALYAGADDRWRIWKQKEIITLNTQRAALIAAKDEQKSYTQKAFGKDEAVRRLVAKASDAARLKQNKM